MATFVLIPGAGGQAWYWHRLVPLLEADGHAAIAVELPTGDDSAGLGAYADAVVTAVGSRGHLVVVGQSMGAMTAPLVCRRLRVDLLVLVNPMIPVPGESGGDWWHNTGQAAAAASMATAEGRDPEAAFDPLEVFFHDVPDSVVAEAMAMGEPPQSDRPFTDPWPLAAWPAVATKVVSGADDRLFPVDFQRRQAQDRLDITPEVVPGGHLVALSRPDELARQLESYLPLGVRPGG
jgi:surfactin synthase thioesterase subunit